MAHCVFRYFLQRYQASNLQPDHNITHLLLNLKIPQKAMQSNVVLEKKTNMEDDWYHQKMIWEHLNHQSMQYAADDASDGTNLFPNHNVFWVPWFYNTEHTYPVYTMDILYLCLSPQAQSRQMTCLMFLAPQVILTNTASQKCWV